MLSKVPKRVSKRMSKMVESELKNRTPAKHGKCGFDTVFTRFCPCWGLFLGIMFGYKSGVQTHVHKKTAVSKLLEALVTSWRVCPF